jgi:hypothetical protein
VTAAEIYFAKGSEWEERARRAVNDDLYAAFMLLAISYWKIGMRLSELPPRAANTNVNKT